MAEMPRELFAATTSEGDPLGPGAKLVLAYLWTYVAAAEAEAYRKRKGPAKAPRVTADPAQLAKVFGFDDDSVRRHLRALREAGYAVHHQSDPETHVALLDQAHRDEYLKVFGQRG